MAPAWGLPWRLAPGRRRRRDWRSRRTLCSGTHTAAAPAASPAEKGAATLKDAVVHASMPILHSAARKAMPLLPRKAVSALLALTRDTALANSAGSCPGHRISAAMWRQLTQTLAMTPPLHHMCCDAAVLWCRPRLLFPQQDGGCLAESRTWWGCSNLILFKRTGIGEASNPPSRRHSPIRRGQTRYRDDSGWAAR